MTPLPAMKNVVDYAHSQHRSNFADLYLCSKAKFFIGCTSGLFFVPVLFKTPILSVNVYPVSPIHMFPNTLTIFARVYSEEEARFLSLREVLDEPTLCYRHSDKEYRDAGLRIVENTPGEILCATQEVLELVSNDLNFTRWTPEQQLFQTRLRETLSCSQYVKEYGDTMFYPNAICRIGSRYLQENW
jgi:putative glycosyltransferase (TIGR04372 family)